MDGGGKQAVTIVSHREFAEGLAAGPEAGGLSQLVATPGNSCYCLFFPLASSRAASPC